MPTPADYPLLSNTLLGAISRLAGRGLCPATGGNFSARIDTQWRLITQSGRDKASIELNDLMLCDAEGSGLDSHCRASDETPLHMALYRSDPEIGCVLHTHSTAATVLSRLNRSTALGIQGFEMQKALAGQDSHEDELLLPIVDNSQDMPTLAQALQQQWQDNGMPTIPALLVRGHGLYAWGQNVSQALRHVEGLEFLLACLLWEYKLGGAP